MSAMTQGFSFSPANPTEPQIGFGPAPIEQNPMDQYGNPAAGGMPTQFTSAGPAQQPPGFQTSWEMAGYPTLEAWKSATGGTGNAQIGFGMPAPTPTPAGGKSGLFNGITNAVSSGLSNAIAAPVAQQFGATPQQQQQLGTSLTNTFNKLLTPKPASTLRTGLQPRSVNQVQPNRYTKTRTRPITPGFY